MTQLEWHKRLAKALDAGITNPNFFLWLRVEVESGTLVDERVINEVVQSTQRWLDGLNAETIRRSDDKPPDTAYEFGPVRIGITALPRKPEARGVIGAVVGNPSPPSAHWI